MPLLDLPNEILLAVAEHGLAPKDVAKLGKTCRALHEFARSLAVWSIIAHNCARVHPLPLPAFRTMQSLSVIELIKVCRHHVRLLENTANLPRPNVSNHRILILDASDGGIYHFAFLPGGRYVIALHLNGTFTCWDTFDGPGRLLARHFTYRRPISWNFHMLPEKSEVMVVIVTVAEDRTTYADVLRLIGLPSEDIDLEVLASISPIFSCDRVHIQDNIVCATGMRRGSRNRLLLLFDPIRRERVYIDTGVSEKSRDWDSLTDLPNGLMLYREDETRAYTHWYSDVRSLMEELRSDAAGPLIVHLRPPDGSQNYVFEDDCTLSHTNRGDWFITHPWNTPNPARDRAASIMTVSRARGTRPGASEHEIALFHGGSHRAHRTVTHHWLRPGRRGPSGASAEETEPTLRRWIFNIGFGEIATGVDDSEVICPGSHGTHLLWIWEDLLANLQTNEPEWTTRRVTMATFLPNGQASSANCPPELVVRDISIEELDDANLDMRRLAAVDVEDSHGIIGLAMEPEDTEDGVAGPILVHLLYL